MTEFDGKITDFRGLLHPLNRRRFLQGASALAGAAAVGAANAPAPAYADDKVLNLLSWPGHGDPAFVKPFEDKYGVKVVAKEYVGGEPMLALMNQSPPGSFDVVLADAEYIHMLQEGGFIDKMNPADYPLADYWPEFQHFPPHWVGEDLYSVMIRFGYLGIAYRTDVLSAQDVESYKVLWDEKIKGKVGFFDWYLPTMGCLSLYDGNSKPFDISADAFDKLKKTMFSLKPQASGFYSMADQFSMLTNGTAAAIPGIGDWVVLLLQKNGVPVSATVPKEGGIQWTESMSIVSSSTKKDLAKAFIQYASSPEGQARSAILPAYWASIPNKKGWEVLNKEHPADAKALRLTFDERNVMDEYKDGKIHIRQTPVQQSIEDWNDAWSEFKAM
ncbi:spermidine/putrescine ABC transporter substrate-binding protein [Ancylobacter sp. MQZ15Z-1]|uniref:Spermidine/putrescine ABC transporter substrate-binding protein n=1 Tax=Ancylobacter mangrovi TaxID=2972472 RepID=A0A9X2PFG9_9HYPH|nr:spermidine/putrescine ABC transporter substrate-binding protein [Ancylobacter mangrovi]MCS0497741.1 spermidine/putrescine ABC transporter substrate-binding protein [Ancylobacter mangrovi]